MRWASDIKLGVDSEKSDKIIKEYGSFNLFLTENILYTKRREVLFEEWEYVYFIHLQKMFSVLGDVLEKQDFLMNVKKASLLRKFNLIIFNKSSKYIEPNINHSDYINSIYDNYLKCLK